MPDDMAEPFITIKTAADGAIKKMGAKDALLPGNQKPPAITVPYFLPIPLGWVPYFMNQCRLGKEAYAYMSKKLQYWAKGNQDLHKGSTMVLTWLRAACTKDTVHPVYSSLDTITWPIPQDAETANWMVAHMIHATVPRPEMHPLTPPPVLEHSNAPLPMDMIPTQTTTLCE